MVSPNLENTSNWFIIYETCRLLPATILTTGHHCLSCLNMVISAVPPEVLNKVDIP